VAERIAQHSGEENFLGRRNSRDKSFVIPNLYRKTFRLLFSGNEDFSVVGSFYFGGRTGEMTVVAYSVNAISNHEGPPQEKTHVANCVS